MNFLTKIQSSDEDTKKRWMVVSTTVIMVVVIYFWLAYFNSLVVGFSGQAMPAQPADTEGSGSTPLTPSSITFLDTMKNGAAIIYDSFLDKIHFFGEILQKPREFIVKPPQ